MEDYTTASAAAANSNAAILQRLLLAQQQQQQALKNAANQNTTVAANALLLEQIRRSQLAVAAAGVVGSGNVQVGSGSVLWEQQQRQMLLLLLQQQRQQNMQQYLQAIALANLNNKVAVNASLDAAALRVHQQQQQLQALNALLANANSAATSANSDFCLPAHNLAPVSAHKRGNSIDGGSSPLRNSPRAVHEFSTSWPASECDSPTSPAASAFADSAESFEPLPSEEEFEMHLMTVQTSYFSQE